MESIPQAWQKLGEKAQRELQRFLQPLLQGLADLRLKRNVLQVGGQIPTPRNRSGLYRLLWGPGKLRQTVSSLAHRRFVLGNHQKIHETVMFLSDKNGVQSLYITYSGKEVRAVLCDVQQRGQGLVEYALILVLVVLVVIVVLTVLGPTIGNAFSRVNSSLP